MFDLNEDLKHCIIATVDWMSAACAWCRQEGFKN